MDKQQFISAIGGMQESLRRFLLVLTHGDEELANDLAQEAILKAYLHCATFEQKSALQTWVFRIVYNEYLNEQNKYWNTHRVAVENYESVDIVLLGPDLWLHVSLYTLDVAVHSVEFSVTSVPVTPKFITQRSNFL